MADDETGDIAVRMANVWKMYSDGTVAVRDVSLDIHRNEFFSLLGPSGCGKTTSLRMIAGFEQPTAGVIALSGKPIQGVPAYKRNVNTVFQSYALFPHMTVAKNVAYGLERKKVDKAEVRRRVGEMLELVELAPLADRRPDRLSGGQQQRVALARALVNYPEVLLLDEPLGALDLKLRKQMQIELARIQRDVGITFIYVTHDQEEALTMSDRLAVMSQGRVEQVGTPWDVYEQPATGFVAGFIGTSNLLRGTVVSVDAGWAALDGELGGVFVPADGLRTGGGVNFTVRPEKLSLDRAADTAAVADATAAGRCRVDGTVTDIVYQGVATQYLVATPSGARLTVFVQNRTNASDVAAEGEAVVLSWERTHNVVLPGDAAAGVDAAESDAQEMETA